MAADILGPRATLIPVGKDQEANVEVAASLAKKFNGQFGNTFTIPKAGTMSIKVPGLSGGKMSKSDEHSNVSLHDTFEEILQKYLKFGVTDPGRISKNAPGKPEDCVSVYPVHKLLCDQEDFAKVTSECSAGTRSCVDCKRELATRIDSLFAPFREKRRELASKQGYVREVLHYGGLKAREIIQPTLAEVREKLGIIAP